MPNVPTRSPAMPAPPRSRQKNELGKVFLLDAQGGYGGEVILSEDCVVEYGDFLAAVPEAGLGDGQSIFLGEHRATFLQGEKLSLVVISKGPVPPPEAIEWGRTALAAAEAQLSTPGEAPGPPAGPDRGVLENLAKALEAREAQIAEREAALGSRETLATRELEDRLAALRADLETLQARLAESEAERGKLRGEAARATQASPAAPDAKGDRAQLEKDRKMLQRRALDLLDREEKLRTREHQAAAAAENMSRLIEENERLRAQLDSAMKAAAAPPSADIEAARRELDLRVKILQQKALDLLDREERLRKEQDRLRAREGG